MSKKGQIPKRASNPKKKEMHKRSWLAGQKRKEERRQAQHERENKNKALRAAGKLTPWEEANTR